MNVKILLHLEYIYLEILWKKHVGSDFREENYSFLWFAIVEDFSIELIQSFGYNYNANFESKDTGVLMKHSLKTHVLKHLCPGE